MGQVPPTPLSPSLTPRLPSEAARQSVESFSCPVTDPMPVGAVEIASFRSLRLVHMHEQEKGQEWKEKKKRNEKQLKSSIFNFPQRWEKK
jgi:hypothetical protein